MIPYLMTYSVAALKMNQKPCDFSRKSVEAAVQKVTALYSPGTNISAGEMNKFYGEAQQEYSRLFTSGGSCVDNWGFYAEEAQLADIKEEIASSKSACEQKVSHTYGLNMYKMMVTHGLPDAALEGKQVLEVSSGRGAGAAYVAKHYHPAKYTGVDLNKDRVDVAIESSGAPNLAFKVGSALELPIEDSRMDFVLNVEASFHYPSFEKFISEVYRVLKPGGKFLWVAPLLIQGDTVAKKENQFATAGFHPIKTTDISQNVLKSRQNHIAKSDKRELEQLCAFSHRTPGWAEWWCLPGSIHYQGLEKGENPYIRIVAEKPH